MKCKFNCSVKGRDDIHVIEGDFIGTESQRRQQAADAFARKQVNLAVDGKSPWPGRRFDVLVEDDLFVVSITSELSVRKKERVFECEFAGDNRIHQVDAQHAYDACVYFIKQYWEPRHGIQFLARVRPDFVVRANVSANGLSFKQVSETVWDAAIVNAT